MGKKKIIAKEKYKINHKKSRNKRAEISHGLTNLFFDGEKSVQMFRSAIIAFSILIAAGSFYLAHETTYYSKEADLIRHEKEEKIAWMRQIDGAILNMRKTRDDIARECKFGKSPSAQEQDTRRNNARIEFMRAYIGSRFVFDESVQNKARELIRFDNTVKDVCAQNAPDDEAWKRYLFEIDIIMGEFLQKDAANLDFANQKVSEIERTPFWRFLWPY